MDLDMLLQHSNPLTAGPRPSLAEGTALAAATVAEAASLGPSPRPVPRLRRRRLALGLLAALVPATAAAASIGGIHTGWLPTKSQAGTEMTPGEEVLVLSDPGIVPVVKAATKTVALPPGETWAPLLARFPVPLIQGVAVTSQRDYITERVQGYATCKWEASWVHGDAAAKAQALAVIETMPTWFVYTHSPDMVHPIHQLVTELQHGNDQPLLQDLKGNCTGIDAAAPRSEATPASLAQPRPPHATGIGVRAGRRPDERPLPERIAVSAGDPRSLQARHGPGDGR
jgi:hypothetical protein